MFDIEVFNRLGLLELIFRCTFHLLVMFTLVKGIYFSKTRNKKFSFTFFLIGIVVFFICFLLESVEIQLGFALGLFAIFGIIRYRTISIDIKEMTYLFIVLGVSIINSITNINICYLEIIITNIIILTLVYFSENFLFKNSLKSLTIIYDKIEIINFENQSEVIKDLENKLHINIEKIDLNSIDYKKESAKIKVFYKKTI